MAKPAVTICDCVTDDQILVRVLDDIAIVRSARKASRSDPPSTEALLRHVAEVRRDLSQLRALDQVVASMTDIVRLRAARPPRGKGQRGRR